jgi:hypothetical protein
MAKLFHLTARNQANAGYKVWFWADAKFNILKFMKNILTETKKILLVFFILCSTAIANASENSVTGKRDGLGSFSYYWTSDAGNAGDETKGSVTFNLFWIGITQKMGCSRFVVCRIR